MKIFYSGRATGMAILFYFLFLSHSFLCFVEEWNAFLIKVDICNKVFKKKTWSVLPNSL